MGDAGELIIGGRPQVASLTLTHDNADEYVTTIIATANDAGLNASIRVATSPGDGGLSAFLGDSRELPRLGGRADITTVIGPAPR